MTRTALVRTTVVLCIVTCVLLLRTGTVDAQAPFKKPFEEKYVTSSDDAEFKAAFRKASCNVCHVKDKPKDWLNRYGLELAKLMPGNVKERLQQAKAESRDAHKAENEKLLEELKAALIKAETITTKDGTPFGTLFKEHQLPTEEGARSLYEKDTTEKSDETKADDK